MSRWFRFYDEVLNDPKVQRLAGEKFKGWINLLCIASKNDGVLPSIEDIAFALRLSVERTSSLLDEFCAAGLLDPVEVEDSAIHYEPHNWNGRQFKSDVSNERVKRHRQRKCNVTPTVTETPPDTEQKQIQKTEQKDLPADAGVVVKAYAFEDGIIRLNQRDFDAWQKAYSQLDLAAELLSLSKWAESEGKNWFHAVKGALAKRNREVKSAKDRLNAEGGFKWNGIEGVL